MSDFLLYLKNGRGYTDYDIKLLKYFFKAMFYEVTKFIMMGVFFFFLGYLYEYLFGVTILLIIRTSSGGLHFKTYIGCFVFTILFFLTSVVLLPLINVPQWLMMTYLLICMVLTNYIGPITSCFRPAPDGVLIRKSKKNSTLMIFLYCLLVFIIPENPYISVGFWIIILQTVQLTFAHIINVRR